MAIITRTLDGGFQEVYDRIKRGVLDRSSSATLEEAWEARGAHSRCATLVFERYSWTGSNRVSMTVTLYQEADGPIRVCGITSGGSQAVFFKLNTIGEESFLDTLKEIL